MFMKKLLGYVLGGAAALTLGSAAQAAQFLTITGPSGTFGDDTVGCSTGATAPCSFTRTFSFTTPAGFTLGSFDVSSIFSTTNPMTNIDFSSVTLNGVSFATLSTGTQEFRNLLNQTLVTGATNTLLVSGTTGGNAAFSGNLSFAAVSAVPEPATWGMMLIGFGAVGYSMRRRTVGYKAAQAV
jgi:hypothetical protein